MIRRLALLAPLLLASCLDAPGEIHIPATAPTRTASAAAPTAAPPPGAVRDGPVGETLIAGSPQGSPAPALPPRSMKGGDVNINLPGVDVQTAAKAVLGDMLRLQYTVSPEVHATVTVTTQKPIARSEVFRLFEAALANANLAITERGGVYAILPVEQARGQAPVVSGDVPGFATEVVHLNYVGAEELRRLIDPILPNVITGADTARSTLSVSGTEGQRSAIKDLVRQFDVDWLRNTSFALFTPQRTDSRLIVPELDKLINADGAPTKGLVRLIAMDRLNGILAVSTQPRYLEDVRRWIEVLDREGQSSERRVFVYRVQNGRSADLAKVLAGVLGARSSNATDLSRPGGRATTSDDSRPNQGGAGQASGFGGGGLGGSTASTTFGGGSSTGAPIPGAATPASNSSPDSASTQPVTADIQTEDLHVKISSDETNNAVVVYASPRDYAVIEDALRKLDIPATQVMIEAAIVEVTLNDKLQYGVQWQAANGTSSAALSQGATASPTTLFPGFTYFYSHSTVAASLTALEALTKINVVSAPKLMVLNNQTASLQVGNQVPTLSESSVSTIGSNAPVVNSIEYRDTGIILKITPRVNSSGVVLLDLSQEVSAVIPSTTDDIGSPTISTRKISTSVVAQDGEVVALGGLISNSITDTKTGLPFLSRVKFLNALFGGTNKENDKTELIVLLRPRVVRSVEDGRALTEELRDKLKTLSPLLPPATLP